MVPTILRVKDSKLKKEAAYFRDLVLSFKLFYFIWKGMLINIS